MSLKKQKEKKEKIFFNFFLNGRQWWALGRGKKIQLLDKRLFLMCKSRKVLMILSWGEHNGLSCQQYIIKNIKIPIAPLSYPEPNTWYRTI